MRKTTVAISTVQCQHRAWCSQPISKQVIQSAYPSAEGKLTMCMLYSRKKQCVKKIHYFDSTETEKKLTQLAGGESASTPDTDAEECPK